MNYPSDIQTKRDQGRPIWFGNVQSPRREGRYQWFTHFDRNELDIEDYIVFDEWKKDFERYEEIDAQRNGRPLFFDIIVEGEYWATVRVYKYEPITPERKALDTYPNLRYYPHELIQQQTTIL